MLTYINSDQNLILFITCRHFSRMYIHLWINLVTIIKFIKKKTAHITLLYCEINQLSLKTAAGANAHMQFIAVSCQ